MTPGPIPVRGLTEGAILAALVALFTVAATFLPVAGIASFYVTPIPLTLLVVRHGARIAVLAALVAALIAAALGGPLTGLVIILTFAPLGIALGVRLRAPRPAARTLIVCGAVATASILVNLGLTLVISGVNPVTTTIEAMRQGQENALRFYNRLGISGDQLEQMSGVMRQVVELMPRIIPLLIVIGGVTTAYVNFEVTRFVLRRFGIVVPALPPVSSWRAPALFLWTLPAGMGLLWASSAWAVPFAVPGETLRMLPYDDLTAVARTAAPRFPALQALGLNLSILAQMVYSLLGLVAAWVLLERYRAPRWLRWTALAFAFTSPPLGMVVFFLGLADAAFDLRGRWRAARTAEASP
ncbi:MAG: YybS family protein [Armatimonadota bacterium]|nr:YybS family protein [Armatimonadota bacterium]MDR7450936.1 YybS family protein [Armatimonadota bacterium]MDR7465858.1 YybS family protein [Armatimonadota bacterium]MDR7493766.1 YybS family protein [Armatimonadota bacterium]MDR7498372.1 YybS family protein [Armatimonadota bacterium]